VAITIDWPTGVISVPQADITFISGTLYELDTDWFRLQLRALEASEEGMPWPPTHTRNDSVTVAGTTIAQVIEIVNGYSVQFTPDSQWTVRLAGSNNNIFDVENGILVQNQVQVIPSNSAGLIVTTTGSGLSAAQDQKLTEIHGELRSIEGGKHHSWFQRVMMAALGNKITGPDQGVAGTVHARDMADTKDRITATVNTHGWRTSDPTKDGD